LPVNNWVNINENQVLSGNIEIKVNAFDGNYGTGHGAGIQQINYQIFSASDLSNYLNMSPISQSPYYWTLNTLDYPDGNYQIRSGAISLDPNERKWITANIVIKNNVTSTLESEKTGFKVYPNPFNNLIIIETEDESLEWIIRDYSGKELMKGSETKIDLSELADGVYFLSNGNQMIKLSKTN
jgi:hypothetical protein